MRVLSIGEVLWDCCGSTKTLGGAPMNFAAHLSSLGDCAAIVSAIGSDEEGRQAFEVARDTGVDLRFLQVNSAAPTGMTSLATLVTGETYTRIHHPAAYQDFEVTSSMQDALRGFNADWIYIGTLFHAVPKMAATTLQLRQYLDRSRLFYDLNLRHDNWNSALVECLSRNADVVKMNEPEARTLSKQMGFADFHEAPDVFCTQWLQRYDLECICVTLGANGCYTAAGNDFHQEQCTAIDAVDALGAGDAFSAGFLHAWHRGLGLRESARLGNLLGGLVASKPGAIPTWTEEERSLLRQQFHLRTSTAAS